MVKEMRRLDVLGSPELSRLAEEVVKSGVGVVLHDAERDLAIIEPAPKRSRRKAREKTQAELEAFWSAAGSWADVDVDEFMKRVYEARDASILMPTRDLRG